MRHTGHLLSTIVICIAVLGCNAQQCSNKNTPLITENLENWDYYLADKDVHMEDVWHVADGVLVCKGNPLGYLYTNQNYRDFMLKLQWRWPEDKDPGKGGVLIRTTSQNKIWPKSLEAQINAPDAGDFWGLNGYSFSGPDGELESIDHDQFGKLTNLKKTKSMENPPGQWNSYEIIAKGDTVTLIINGEIVNKAINCDLDSGTICITSEGSEIHFRNIEITPIEVNY